MSWDRRSLDVFIRTASTFARKVFDLSIVILNSLRALIVNCSQDGTFDWPESKG